jgi:hypothetical protein
MNHRMLRNQTENEPCCSHSQILSYLECGRPEAAARNQPRTETSRFSQYGCSFYSPQRCIAVASLETIPSSNPQPAQQTQRKYICSLIRLWAFSLSYESKPPAPQAAHPLFPPWWNTEAPARFAKGLSYRILSKQGSNCPVWITGPGWIHQRSYTGGSWFLRLLI